MIITEAEVVAAAGLLAGIVSLLVNWRQGCLRARELRETREIQARLQESLRQDMEHGHRQCLGEIAEIRETVAETEKNAQVNPELLRDGQLSMPARARALRMLRSGMAAETTAVELGLARNEVQLLEKVSILLARRS
jgi:hypothetical protein